MRELRQHASRYLDEVKAGGTVEVTERGELVAMLVPVSPASAERDRLVKKGRLLPARTAFSVPKRSHAPELGRTASDALAELRAERLP